jgi:hypothetical protein
MTRRQLFGWGVFAVAPLVGQDLAPERVRILGPVLAMRRTQIRTLREYPVPDTVAPAHGVWRP